MKKIIFVYFIWMSVAFAKDYVVKFKRVLTTQEIAELKSKYLINKFYQFDNDYFNRLYQVQFNETELVKAQGHPLIEKIEEIFEIDEAYSINPTNEYGLSNDPFGNYQWGLNNTDHSLIEDNDDINSELREGIRGQDIQVNTILDSLTLLMNKEIIVAILDSGVDLDHEDLKDNIYRNKLECTQAGDLEPLPTIDRDGNGHIGDCLGWDFTAPKDGSHRPYDDRGHGTHIAGIVSAVSNNKKGIRGLTDKIKILPVKILKPQERLDGAGLTSFTDRIAKGILYATKMGAKVINLSLGWPRSMDTEYVRQAILTAQNAGVVIVAAAGNNHSDRPIFPCYYSDVICVGATTIDGSIASFSNYGGGVDILAPGDQILSTIPNKIHPLYFSVEGYDIKNGTSQASPMVASVVAILNSIFPDISLNEIKARLFESSLKVSDVESNFTLNGLVQTKDAINLTPTPVIRPDFKNLQTVIYDPNTKIVKFNVLIKNYWQKTTKDSNVEIYSQNPDLILSTYKFKIPSGFDQNDILELNIEGQIKNLEGESDTLLHVNIDGRIYRHQIILVKDIKFDKNILSLKIGTDGDHSHLAKIIDGKLFTGLLTVSDRFRQHEQLNYYATKKVENNLQLEIYQSEDQKFKLVKRSFTNVTRILNIFLFDLNYDGKMDYLIRGLYEDGEDKAIIYYYLNENLADLFPGQSVFKLYPDVVTLDVNNHHFIPLNWNGVKMAVPLFVKEGKIPKIDLEPNHWDQEENITTRQAYYFEPTNIDGKFEFVTRVINSFQFINAFKIQFGLSWDEDVSVLGLLSQSYIDYKKGIGHFQISVGKEFSRRYFKVVINENLKWEISNMNFGNFLAEGHFRVPLTYVDNNNLVHYFHSSSLVGFQNDTLSQYLMLDLKNQSEIAEFFRYEHKSTRDHLLGVLASFWRNDSLYTFYQSKGFLIFNLKKNDSFKSWKRPIHRSSFLSGSNFNELFYPIISDRNEEAWPGYYIDATQIHSGHVYALTATELGLQSKMTNNIFVPKNCATLNPVYFKKNENFTFLCLENNELSLKFLPID